MNKIYQIAVIGGDGIGPEVISATVEVLKQLKLKLNFVFKEAGYQAFLKYKTPLPKDTLDFCIKADAVLFGAVTTPPLIKNYQSPIITLRKKLDLYVNVRPVKSLPRRGYKKLGKVDLVILRENSEGLYSGRERVERTYAVAERIVSVAATKRFFKFVFEYAKVNRRSKVTVIHKANILRLTDGLFLKICRKVAKDYNNIELEEMLVDSCAYRLARNIKYFDILATSNMFGDILSDLSCGLVAGLGVAPSANIGNIKGLFEPVHGSVPKYAGMNKANPLACLLSAVLMLEFLGEKVFANKLNDALTKTIENRYLTQDLGGKLTTTQFSQKVIQNIN